MAPVSAYTPAPPVNVIARMRLRSGEVIEETLTIPGEHWALMCKFLDEVQRLRQAEAVSDPSVLSFTWGVNEDGPYFRENSKLSKNDFWALLNVLRPFVLLQEETHYPAVRKKLARHVQHEALRAFLDRGLDMFTGRRLQQRWGMIVSENIVLNSDEMLMKWLNAYEFHRDKAKRRQFEALHDELLPRPLTEAIYMAMLLDKTRAIIELGGLISCMQRSATCDQLLP